MRGLSTVALEGMDATKSKPPPRRVGTGSDILAHTRLCSFSLCRHG
jgi:hypothetical protein